MNRETFDLMLATNGGKVIQDTAVHPGPFAGLLVLEDGTKIAAVTCEKIEGSYASATREYAQGMFIPLTIATNLQLSGGSILAVKSVQA